MPAAPSWTSRRHGIGEGDEAKAKKRKKGTRTPCPAWPTSSPATTLSTRATASACTPASSGWKVQGATKDYLKIQYSGSDVLYVPVTQLDLLSRYTPPGDEDKVKLAKLGGAEWQRTRARVKKATEEMAQELIELYARRKQAKGFAFPARWGSGSRTFEARFEYDETEDQLAATAEIKNDMEHAWPMDRLLCGDVGGRQDRGGPAGRLQVP